MSPDTNPHPSHEDLYAYRDGELPAERRLVIEAHVVGCRACRESIDELSELEAQLRLATDGVEEGYFDRLTERTMERVRAADVAPRVERRRSVTEIAAEETRRRPRFAWPALTAAVGAAATVIVVVGLLIRQERVWRSAPPVTVLERSAPDAARRAAGSDTTVLPPSTPGPADTRAMSDATKEKRQDVASGAKKDASPPAIEQERLAKTQAEEGKLSARDEAAEGTRSRAIGEAKVETQSAGDYMQRDVAAAAPPAGIGGISAKQQAAASVYETAIRRFALPPVWGPGVSDDLVLRAEPSLRNLYRTGGATTALDSARVRLYLAEASRIRLGSSAPDSATAEDILHHYRRAIQLGASDPATHNTARARLEEFEREIREP
jgi:anti-sigma factor RsiW